MKTKEKIIEILKANLLFPRASTQTWIEDIADEILASLSSQIEQEAKTAPIDELEFVHEWFYKLSIGQATQGEVADAIVNLFKSKLKEELIQYELDNPMSNYASAEIYVNEYLEKKNNGNI